MRYKEYGKTGNKVSRVGFGGMRFDLNESHEDNAKLVRYAFDKGINYFDTAPGYCNDESETIMGMAIKEMPREQIYVSTKHMPMRVKTKEDGIKAVERSLKKLNVDYIDFFHIWCIRDMAQWDYAFKEDGQYEALLECKERGLIKHIVTSSHLAGHDIRKMIANDKVEGVLMGVNMLNFPYRWDGVLACNEKNLGVVTMNPLGGGLIPQHEEQFKYLCQEGETATEAALRFNFAAPQITVTLNGFSTKAHVDTACRVVDRAEPMSAAELEAIRSKLNTNMNMACTGCNYCKDCPMDIPVAAYMQLYNNHLLFKQDDEAMMKHLKDMMGWGFLMERGPVAGNCIQCGQCESACTQHLPIIERLEKIANWESKIKES